ncbi:MAG: flagellar basal body rod protein FlgC [Pseudomonadota bacterium]
MSLYSVFDLAGSGMRAQSLRLNATSSNLANAESVAGNEAAVYRARRPVFETVLLESRSDLPEANAGVRVRGMAISDAPAIRRYQPDHPLADRAGYTYGANVNAVEEMVDMLSAARSYQSNVEALNTAKEMLLGTLRLGQ